MQMATLPNPDVASRLPAGGVGDHPWGAARLAASLGLRLPELLRERTMPTYRTDMTLFLRLERPVDKASRPARVG